MEQDSVSPLQHFVVAKRTISAMFHQLLEFVREGSDFVEGKMEWLTIACVIDRYIVILLFKLYIFSN